ncbi:hypothetical protein [uncultured Reyranella sp.]|uniref:hypothetical protein n=1 Tax=uncultured Reyranella sp. TaxID=735512 RepID=UPI0025F58878|nr:hypothetical protein [uncultured Reyranella sp.]
MRKMVDIESARRTALELLASDTGKRLQDLFDEAIADLLKKHGRPTTTSEMVAASARRERKKRR